jgi:hypothetical protein
MIPSKGYGITIVKETSSASSACPATTAVLVPPSASTN